MLAGVLERLLKGSLSRWLSVTASHLQVLNVGVWAGDLELQQLHMLPGVLDELRLPLGLGVKLRKGMVGSLRIKANWARLTTQPVEVRLADVYLLGEIDPTRLASQSIEDLQAQIAKLVDPEVIRSYMAGQKAAIIAAAEASWEQIKSADSAAASKNQSYMSSFTASLAASVLDNLSVTVQRIHVCIATAPKADPLPLPIAAPASPHTASALAAASHESSSPQIVSPQLALPAMAHSPEDNAAAAATSASTAAAESHPVPPVPLPLPIAVAQPAVASPAAAPSIPFPVGWSLGLVLSQLSVYATDKDGSPSFVKSTGSSVYKQVKLEAFGVYLSTNATPLPDAAAGSDGLFMKLMAKPFANQLEPEEEKSDSDTDEEDAAATAADAAPSPAKAASAHNSDTSSDDEAKDAFEDAREHVPLRPGGSESSSPVIVPSNHRRPPSSSRVPQTSALKQSKQVFEKVEGLEYLLCPCDATVKLRLTKSDSRGAAAADHSAAASSSASAESADERAKLSVNISVEKLQLEFTSKQYEILQALAANISSSEHALRHAPYILPQQRPGHSQQVTRAWWRYALDVTRKECRERLQQWDPRFILSYRRSFHDYAPLYAASLSRKITPLQSAHMQALEDEYDAHHIIMWRSLFHKQNRIKEALMHVSKQRGKQKKHAKAHKKPPAAGDEKAATATGPDDAAASAPEKSSGSVMGWLGSWLPSGSSSASSSDDSAGDASSLRLSEAEREQILKMLGYDPYASIEQMQATSLDNTMKLDFTLGQASITLFQAQIAEPPPRPVASALRGKNGRRHSRIDPASLPNFPLAPRSLTTRQAFLIASLSDFSLHAQQGNAGVSVELSLDHLLVEDRMASCERFAAIIMPRAHQPKAGQQGGAFHTPFMTPQRRRDHATDASPLMLPASAATQDGGISPLLSSSSPELSGLNSSPPDPPLLQLRLSYYFPSQVLPSATTSSQAHIDLWLATQPLDIVYSAGAISTLQRFLWTPTLAANPVDNGLVVLWQELEVAAMNAFQDLKRRSAAKIDYVLNHHVRIGLDINIQAPTLLIYHHGPADQGSCLAINLGHVTCATQEKPGASGTGGGTIAVVEPEEGSILKNAADGSAWAMSSSLDASAAAARRRALSGDLGGSAPDAGQRSELFYDQFRLVIENMDVQLIPLYVDAKGVASLQSPGSAAFQSQTPSSGFLPSLQLPAAHGASFVPQQRSLQGSPPPNESGGRGTGSRSSRSSSRKAWLARRRNLNSRSKRSFGCGPVIDAFTPTLHVMSSVLPSDTSLPRMKIFAHLPPLKLHLSSAKMRRIIDILASFPSMAAQVLAPVASATTPHGGHGSLGGGHSNTPSFGSPSPSLAPLPRSSSLFTPEPASGKAPSNRRSSSSFQTSKESAVATAAQVLDSRANDKKDETKPKLPADWIMLHFQLTASQLSIDLSFDCDAPPEQVAAAAAASASSPGFALEPISSTFELVSFLLEGVELSFTQFPYSSALEAQVLGLFVEDCINREHAACRFLIASGAAPRLQQGNGATAPAANAKEAFETEAMPPPATPAASQSALTGLIYLRYNHTTDSSPTAVSASSDDLQLDFNSLQFNLNRKTFQLLMEFIQPALDALEAPPAILPAPHSHPSHGHHAHFEDGGVAADMSRSVDYTAAQLPSHTHAKSMPINMSASIGDVRASPAPAVTGSPHTPERHTQQHAPTSPSVFTPARPSLTAREAPPSQQDLLARISDKISSDGEVGSRANRSKFKPSALQVKVQARINLITLSLNQENEHDDQIATIAKTEIQGLSVSLQHQDCPCGGCTQATATLANLTLYEVTTTAPDNYSQYSRRSETHSAAPPHLHHPGYPLAHSSSANSLRDSLSPMQQNDLPQPRGSFNSTRQKRIFWKRHASDTALISFNFTQHSLQMDSTAAKSSAHCPIRFRTIRSGESDVPPVDPASLSFDQMVSVSLSSVQLVFVPDFLLRLQSYFEESLLKQAGDRAAEKARLAFTELKQLAEANCTLLKYGINIDNPLIFVPHTTSQPVNRPIMHSPSPSIPMGSFPLSGPSSPTAAFQMAHEHLYDDVRARTDYLVLDLGKMSFSNHFLLSEERRALVPVPESASSSSGIGGFQQPLFSPRRKRKSMAPAGRVPMEQMQLRLSAMNLILASPPAHRASEPSNDSAATSNQSLLSDDAGQFWLTASKKKIFEDVNVSADIALVMLVPHLAFVDVPNVRVHGTVSTIHAHVNEQLMTFLLGVYTVELAPLLAPPIGSGSSSSGSHFDPEHHDDMLEMEVEEDVPPQASKSKKKGGSSPRKRASAAPPSSSERASLASRAAALKSFSADNIRDMDVSMSADLMASIDEELDDDAEADHVAPTLAPTAATEQVGVMVDLTFEGVVLDFMLTPPALEAESQFMPHHLHLPQQHQQHQPQARNQRGSFLSPHAHAPFLTPIAGGGSMGGAAPLNHFPFVPVRHHPIQPRPQPFMQVSAKSLTVAYRLTNITQRPEIDAEPVRSALTSIELSLGHLSLEDARPELRHSLLKQVIGGHKDDVQPRAHPVGVSHHRATSVAFDLSAAGGPMFSPAQERSASSSSSSVPPQTVLPDLKVRFESLAIERVAPAAPDDDAFSDAEEDEEGASTVVPVESVTVEMSVDVEFTAPRLVISPSFLTAVMGFADAYATLIDAGLHADTRLDVGGQSHAPAAAAPAAVAAPNPASQVEMRIHARVRDPQVWLMSDVDVVSHTAAAAQTMFAASSPTPIRHASMSLPAHRFPSDMRDSTMPQHVHIRPLSCVVVRGNVEVGVKVSQTTAVEATVNDIEALMCYRAYHLRLADLNPQPVPVFKPFSIKADYQLRSPAAASSVPVASAMAHVAPVVPPEHHLIVDIGLLDSCFSFLQMSSAANILLALVQAIPATEEAAAQASKPPKSSSSLGVGGVEAASSSPVAFLAAFKGVVQVRTNGIQLALVNDAPGYYVPLLSFAINPLLLSVLDASHPESLHSDLVDERKPANQAPAYLSARFADPASAAAPARNGALLIVSMGLEAKYYNQSLGEFEQFVDSWRFDVRADERSIVLASKQLLAVQITPASMLAIAQGMDSLQTHFLSVLASAPRAPPPKRAASTRRADSRNRGSVLRHQPAAAPAVSPTSGTDRPGQQGNKASYFLVRNETGCRLRFWSVEVEHSGGVSSGVEEVLSPKAMPSFTVDPNDEHTVALRQYIGVGGIGGAASDEKEEGKEAGDSKMRWLYRSPMLGLQLEAGRGTERWNAWHSIQAVPLVASTPDTHADAGSARTAVHAHTNLTLHPLLPSPEHDSGPDDIESDGELSAGVIACHLVSQPDAFGSSAQVLVVSSALLLVNRTFVNMDVCLVDSVAEQVLFQQLVRSGQSLPMPVLLVPWRRVKLLLRPAGRWMDREWEWSSAGFRLSLLQYDAAKHTVLKCQPQSANEADAPMHEQRVPSDGASLTSNMFCCGLNVFSTAAATSPLVRGHAGSTTLSLLEGIDEPEPTLYTIALDPPLSFKNLLGCDVAYQVTLRERREDASFIHTRVDQMDLVGRIHGSLPHRQEVHWYHMDLGAASSAVVTLQLRRSTGAIEQEHQAVSTPRSGYSQHPFVSSIPADSTGSGDWTGEWSSEVVIHSTTDSTAPSESLILHDSEGVRLRIQLDYSAKQQNSIKSANAGVYPYAHAGEGLVTAFVPHWFSNHSGLPLVYATADDSIESDDTVQLCAGQSKQSLCHAAQALQDLEGLDYELALKQRGHGHEDNGLQIDALSSDSSHKRSWFHFRDARREFGTETRSGLHALLPDPEQVIGEWKWTPELARRPLDEHVFLLNPVTKLEELLAQEEQQKDAHSSQPVEVYMLPVRDGEKRRAVVRLPNTNWSQPFNVDTVGWDGTLQLTEQPRPPPSDAVPRTDSAYDLPRPSDRPFRVYTLGVSICMHPHLRFHRTKIIQFTPRYVLSNQTLHTLEFRQIGSAEVRTLKPKQQLPIHWLDQGAPVALSFRVDSYGWQWAAKRFGIALESVGVFSVRLRNSHTHDSAVMHVWTKLTGATFEITVLATWEQQRKIVRPHMDASASLQAGSAALANSWTMQASQGGSLDLNSSMTTSQLLGLGSGMHVSTSADDRDLAAKIEAEFLQNREEVPYRIENCSSMRILQFHQTDEPGLIQRLLPFQSCPYAWDEPGGKKMVELYCISGAEARSMHDGAPQRGQRVGSFSLDKIAKYDSVWLPKSGSGRDASDGAGRKLEDQVFVQVYAHGRVRVLKLVDLAWANSAGLTQTQATLNAAAAMQPAASNGWSVELRLAGIGLSLITHVHRTSAQTVSAASISHLRSSSASLALASAASAASSSAHPLAVLGAPYTRQELLHLSIQNIRIRLHESTTNQALKAAIGHIQLDNQLPTAVYPVVFCSVSKPTKTSLLGGIFGGGRSNQPKPGAEPELDLSNPFFNLDAANSSGSTGADGNDGGAVGAGMRGIRMDRARAAAAGKKGSEATTPCWFSVSLLKSHERSAEGFLFMPGLAVRMQLLKINIEEKLINHLLRFGELLAPAIAILNKPASVSSSSVSAAHHVPGPHGGLERSASIGAQQLLGMMAMQDEADLGASPMPLRDGGAPSYSLGRSHSSSFSPSSDGSLTPNSINDSFDEHDGAEHVAEVSFHTQQLGGGIVGRLALPAEAAPLSSLDYSRIDLHQRDAHPSGKVERDHPPLGGGSDASGSSSSLTLAPKLERPLILYFQQLVIHTIEIQVSMSSSGEQGEEDGLGGNSSHPLRVVLRAVGATLLNFEDASLKFAALELPDVFASGEELTSLVQLHYLKQATSQLYRILGSSDFLGNPLSLFSTIATGAGDLIYKPAVGLTESPTGVVTGAFGGMSSFLRHLLYGFSSAGSRMTSSLAKGLSSLSMPDAHLQHGRPGLHVSLTQLIRMPRDGWRHRGFRGLVGGGLRAGVGLGGNVVGKVAQLMDMIRAIVNPLSKLQRTREPLFFQGGIIARLYHLRMARFITAYLSMHPHETFVAALEQVDATPILTGGRRLISTASFIAALGPPSEQPGVITEAPALASSSAASVASAAAAPPPPPPAAAFSAAAAAATPIRVPGGRVCLLLTSHTLVLFAVDEVGHKESRLLHSIPLEALSLPIVSEATPAPHTLLTIEPQMLSESVPRGASGAARPKPSASQRRTRSARFASPRLPLPASSASSSWSSFLPDWLTRLFVGSPSASRHVINVPVLLSPVVLTAMEMLVTAARMQRQRQMQNQQAPR